MNLNKLLTYYPQNAQSYYAGLHWHTRAHNYGRDISLLLVSGLPLISCYAAGIQCKLEFAGF